MNFKHLMLVLLSLLLIGSPTVDAGPLSGAICSAGCAVLVCACYAGAGAVFGTVTAGAATAPALLACNAAFGKCMAACAVATAAPAP